jgi:hypothetical protein
LSIWTPTEAQPDKIGSIPHPHVGATRRVAPTVGGKAYLVFMLHANSSAMERSQKDTVGYDLCGIWLMGKRGYKN